MKKITYLIIYSLLLLTAACEKDTEPANFAPKLTTGEVTNVYRTGATLSGSMMRAEGMVVKEYGILYSTLQSMAEYTEVKVDEKSGGDFTIQLQDLESGKTYYYCTYAYSGYSIAKGEIRNFTTGASNTPVFSPLEVSGADEKSFIVSTSILDIGGGDIFLSGFCWKETNVPGYIPTEKDETGNISNLSEYQLRVKDLKPGKQYAIRAYAVSSKGIGYGETAYVITKTTELPVVSSSVPQDSTETSITLLARILANGAAVTEKGFCYSTEMQEPTVVGLKEIVQMPDTTIYGTISGLKPGNTYYIRAYAKSQHGVGYGDVMTYTILNDGQPIVTTLSAENVGENTAKLMGSISVGDLKDIASFGFVWKTRSSSTENVLTESYPSGNISQLTGVFTLILEGLPAGETVYAYAWAEKGRDDQKVRGQGGWIEFTVDPVVQPAAVGRTTVSNVTINAASAVAMVHDDGGSAIISSGFYYSTVHALPTEEDTHIASLTTGNNITANLTGLKESQTYYIRAYAKNGKGVSYGEVQEFTTGRSAIAPTLSGTVVGEIGETTAVASATVINDGGASVFNKGFCYSLKNELPTIKGDSVILDISEGSSIKTTLKYLKANAKYYIRAYATNKEGTAYGVVEAFTTRSTSSTPTVGATTINAIAKTTAEVSSSISSDGGAGITEKGFCYSNSNAIPTMDDSKITSDISKGDFVGNLEALRMGTLYYVRAYAINMNGVSYGVVNSFTTKSNIPDNSDNQSPDKKQ